MERDAVAGLIGVQLGYIDAETLQTVASRPTEGTAEQSLCRRLVEEGLLDPGQADLLEGLADRVINENEGNVQLSYAALGGNAGTRQTIIVPPRNPESTITREERLDAHDDTLAAPTMASRSASHYFADDAMAITPEHPGRYSRSAEEDCGEIGRGGIGRVVKVHDRHLGRDIALKELLGSSYLEGREPGTASRLSATVDSVVRFLREARVTGQLEHPNIVPVYEVGRSEDGTLYYTMKMVRGKAFSEAIAEAGGLDGRLKLLNHYVDLCQAIAYAHSRGVTHRDIKPQNVMLGEFGETVVLDWGLAKVRGIKDLRSEDLQHDVRQIRDAATNETVMGVAMGTPAYMSPEQAAGMIDEVDEKSDVWSLGAVLYEVLTGRPPFSGRNVHKVLAAVLTRSVQPPRELDPDIPADLAAVCEKALQRKKKDRYGSAKELAEEIEAFRAGNRVASYEYTSWELLKRLISQNKGAATLVATLVAVLMGGSLLLFDLYRTAEESRGVAVAQQREAESQREAAEHAKQLQIKARLDAENKEREAHHNLAIALSEEAARRVAANEFLSGAVFAAAALTNNPHNPLSPYHDPSQDGPSQPAWAEELATLHAHLFRSDTQHVAHLQATWVDSGPGVQTLAVSPSGRSAVVGREDGHVEVWDVKSGKEVASWQAVTERIEGLAIAPDGRTIAVSSWPRSVQLFSLDTYARTRELEADCQRVRTVAFDPTGERLLVGCFDGQVLDLPLVGDAPLRRYTDATGDVRAGVCVTRDGSTVYAASLDKTVRAWDRSSGKLLFTAEGHKDALYALALSPDENQLATGSHDGTIRLWNAHDGLSVAILSEDEGHVIALAFSADGSYLASGSHEGEIRIWDLARRSLVMSMRAHESYTWQLAFVPGSPLLLSSGRDGRVRAWTLRPSTTRRVPSGHRKALFRVAFQPHGKLLAAAGLDGGISLWQSPSLSHVALIPGDGSLVYRIGFSRDGNRLFAVSPHGVTVYRSGDQEQMGYFGGEALRVTGAGFSPDGSRLAVAATDRVELRSVQGHLLASKEADLTRYADLLFTPDGKQILFPVKADHAVVMADAETLAEQRRLLGHEAEVGALAYSESVGTVASGDDRGEIRLWQRDGGRALCTLQGHQDTINVLSFSPDGRFLFSGSDDNTLRVWLVDKGTVVHIQDLGHEVTGVDVSQGAFHFAVADEENLRLFPLRMDYINEDPAVLLHRAEQEAGWSLQGFELHPH